MSVCLSEFIASQIVLDDNKQWSINNMHIIGQKIGNIHLDLTGNEFSRIASKHGIYFYGLMYFYDKNEYGLNALDMSGKISLSSENTYDLTRLLIMLEKLGNPIPQDVLNKYIEYIQGVLNKEKQIKGEV